MKGKALLISGIILSLFCGGHAYGKELFGERPDELRNDRQLKLYLEEDVSLDLGVAPEFESVSDTPRTFGLAKLALDENFLLASSTLLLLVDWGQTRDIARRPEEYHETNPLLGEHPSMKKVDTYFASWILGNFMATKLLQGKWRKAWQHAINVVQVGAVANNYKIGLNVRF